VSDVANRDEEGLVEAARRGSTGAFALLVGLHQQQVRAFLRRACGNWAEADDLAQETFLTAWQKMAGFHGASTLRSWLCGIAWHKLQTARRGWARASRIRAELPAAETFDDSSSRAGQRLDLERALATLPLDQRAAVALCLAAEFSHAEAAEALRLPLGTVKSHVARGRAKLLEALGGAHVDA
jgi:RNA polymerase sigma factor (sigma-70 family)